MPDFESIEPLYLGGLADYHCHCDYSIDAEGSIDEYCQAAIRRGLVELCFTTHYDSSPASHGSANYILVKGEKKPAVPENLAAYVDDIQRAARKFRPMGLTVRLGLEFGWYPHCEDKVAELRDRYDFDYMLCGLHELDSICFCCSCCYEKCLSRFTVEEAVDRYVKELTDAARSGLFDTIAHLDYIRKYGAAFYGPRLDELLLARSAGLFTALKESGTFLEVNTAGMRRGLKDYYPRVKLVNAARRAGVSVYYLGSDAHRPEDVGYDFDAAAPLAAITAVGHDED